MHEYLKLIVVENKLVSFEYFMDEMQLYELYDLLDLIPWANKHSYEQMRFMVWATLKPYLKKKDIGPEKLLPLYTDSHTTSKYKQELSPKEVDKMREYIINKYNKKKNG